MKDNITVFIGYDATQRDAYRTCAHSIRTNSKEPVAIYPLDHQILRKAGLFNRPWLTKEDGSVIDIRDGLTFSTTFAFTRFLSPAYFSYLGLNVDKNNRWLVFVDSDFVFMDDIRNLVLEAEETGRPLSVVKHNYTPKSSTKFNGNDQSVYNTKLWSSLMVFDMESFEWDERFDANNDTGRDLHTFDWIPAGVDSLGSLYEGWNFIPDHSEAKISPYNIRAIHFTSGTPLHKGYEDTKYGGVWLSYYQGMLIETAKRVNDGL